MNDAAQDQARDIRELLSSLRHRRSALINQLRNGGPEAPEWMSNLAQLRAVQEAIDLVKIAQGDQGDYRPSYHGET